MPKEITYGYQVLEATDDNVTILEVMQNNIKRLAEHKHDGDDSISLTYSIPATIAKKSVAWKVFVWSDNANADGLFSVDVTVNVEGDENTIYTFFTGEPTSGSNTNPGMKQIYFEYAADPERNTVTVYSNTKITEKILTVFY